MKKRCIAACWALCAALAAGSAAAQAVVMDEGHVSFDYPESWLVVSPQLCKICAPLLEEAGLDAEMLAGDMLAQGVLSRAYNADFSKSLSVLVSSSDLSVDIYEIGQITDSQRAQLRRLAEQNALWETTGLRTQDVEWQKERGAYWLYIHYIKTRGGQTVGRGLRYLTVHNGQFIMLDQQMDSGRFSNRDLSAFRARLGDLTVTEQVERPVRAARLTAEIPAETTVSEIVIDGVTEPNAMLTAQALDASGEARTLSVGQAGANGAFSLHVELEEEGAVELLLTAHAEGMEEASLTERVTYSAKTLPVSGIAQTQRVTTDTTLISGRTLAGVQVQLMTPYGVSKKHAGNDGSFSFELTTKEAGEYSYTLALDKSGYNQRRVQFTVVREMTAAQEHAAVRSTAVKLSYKQLQRDLPENRGQVVNLYGPVTEVSGSGSTQYVRLAYNKDGNGKWYNPVVIVAKEDMGVRAGDMLSATVTVSGVYEEQDASGKDIVVPRFDLLFVDKVE